jgi:hypothetical protein
MGWWGSSGGGGYSVQRHFSTIYQLYHGGQFYVA